MKNIMSNVINLVWVAINLMIFMPIMYIIGVIKVIKKEATLYTGLKQNNRVIGWIQFVNEFSIKQRIQKFETNQEKLAVVHGIPGDYSGLKVKFSTTWMLRINWERVHGI